MHGSIGFIIFALIFHKELFSATLYNKRLISSRPSVLQGSVMNFRHLLAAPFLLAPLSALAAPPNAVPDERRMLVNSVITIDVLANDSDPDGDGMVLVGIAAPNVGEAIINEDGGITYTPPQDFSGQVTFSYTVEDTSELAEQSTGNVTINVLQNPLQADALTANDNGVAQVLDSVCVELAQTTLAESDPRGRLQLKSRCEDLLALIELGDGSAAQAIQQIAPEETLTLSKVGSNASQFQSSVVGGRLMQLGQGMSAASRGGLTWSTTPYGGAAGDDIQSRWGVFASIQLEDAEKDRTQAEAGFDYSANSLTAGIDYAMSSDWFLGGAFGYTTNDLEYSQAGGSVEADIYTFIAYTSYSKNNFSFDVQAGYGGSNIDVSRHIAYQGFSSAVDINTSGSTNGTQLFLSSSVQYMFSQKALTVYPSATLKYSSSTVESYADTDAGGWDIVLSDQGTDQISFEAAVQATYAFNMSWGVLVPNAELNIVGDVDTSHDEVSGYFAYAPNNTSESGSFSLTPEAMDSMYYQIGLGASFVLPKGFSGFFGLKQTLGYDDYSASQLQAGLRMEL